MSYVPIWVAGIKVNGLQGGATFTTGPTNVGGVTIYKKHTLWNEVYGDLGNAPTGWASILDNDFIDTPITSWAPGYNPGPFLGW